jgi:hypothetical protein
VQVLKKLSQKPSNIKKPYLPLENQDVPNVHDSFYSPWKNKPSEIGCDGKNID